MVLNGLDGLNGFKLLNMLQYFFQRPSELRPTLRRPVNVDRQPGPDPEVLPVSRVHLQVCHPVQDSLLQSDRRSERRLLPGRRPPPLQLVQQNAFRKASGIDS
jgi:hypothetical protein